MNGLMTRLYMLPISVLSAVSQDPFQILEGNKLFTDNAEMRNAGASAYRLLMAVGIVGIMCSLIIGGIKLAFAKGGAARNDAKKAILVKLVIAVVLFGFVSILGMVLTVINSL